MYWTYAQVLKVVRYIWCIEYSRRGLKYQCMQDVLTILAVMRFHYLGMMRIWFIDNMREGSCWVLEQNLFVLFAMRTSIY